MLNKKPIFIVGFQFGGTNILLNLLRSHPCVCSPRGEIQEVFKGKGFLKSREPRLDALLKIWRYLPILLSQKQDIFSLDLWRTRSKFTPKTIARIDRILYDEKFKARGESQNLYRLQDVEYTEEQINGSRLLCKNLNGNIYLTDSLYDMYKDAVFIAIVRNGYALCEGHLRRGRDLKTIACQYEMGCHKMLYDESRIRNYHIVKLEDILDHPIESLKMIYGLADLDLGEVEKIRLETKRMITKEGNHEHVHGSDKKRVIWYTLDTFHHHLQKDVTTNQINRLTEEQKGIIKENAFSSLKHFDYL